jgi:hypothetical protein
MTLKTATIQAKRRRLVELIRDPLRDDQHLDVNELQEKLQEHGITLTKGQTSNYLRQGQTLLALEALFGPDMAVRMFRTKR